MDDKSRIFEVLTLAGFLALALLTTNTATGQSSRYEKFRQWSDSTGKFNTNAKVVSANRDMVTLERESGETATIPFDRLSDTDQEFAQKFQEAVFSKLKKTENESVLAVDVLALYQQFETSGFVDNENRAYIDSQIETLTAQAEAKAIILPDGFVAEQDWPEKKDRASGLITQWIETVQSEQLFKKQQTKIRSAIAEDPSSTEGAIVLALYYELREADFQVAQRYLDDAAKLGERYLPIATEYDKANLVAALNNLAVSYVRDGRVSKAVKTWSQANDVSGFSLPAAARYNLAKLQRMAQDQRSGLTVDRNEAEQVDELVVRTSATGSSGGWKLLAPQNSQGTTRTKMEFVIGNHATIDTKDGTIEDSRCVACQGTGHHRCPNKLCHGGVVKTPVMGQKYVTFPDGTRYAAGYGVIRVDQLKCKTCNGHEAVVCPYCNQGKQNN